MIEQEIESFIADGIYHQAPVYAAVEAHSSGARVIVPLRKDVVVELSYPVGFAFVLGRREDICSGVDRNHRLMHTTALAVA